VLYDERIGRHDLLPDPADFLHTGAELSVGKVEFVLLSFESCKE